MFRSRLRILPQVFDQRFRGVGEALEAGQAQEPRRALDRVDQAEDVGEDTGVAGVALEADELFADPFELLSGLGREIFDELFHRLDRKPGNAGICQATLRSAS